MLGEQWVLLTRKLRDAGEDTGDEPFVVLGLDGLLLGFDSICHVRCLLLLRLRAD